MRGSIRAHPQTLQTAGTQTGSGTGAAFALHFKATAMIIRFVITAAAGTLPTLDLYLQSSADGGVSYFDVIHFAQQTSTANLFTLWSCRPDNNQVIATIAGGDTGLAASTGWDAPIDPAHMRMRWVISGSAGQSFTWSVQALLDQT